MTTKPFRFEEAKDKEEWINGMKEEIDSIKRNETPELVDLPISCDAIRLKWLYRLHYNPHGSIKKYIGRLVDKAYGQHYDVDYF